MRLYYSKHADPECECCSDRPEKQAIRAKWVTWIDFLDNYPLFRNEHREGSLATSVTHRVALRRDAAFEVKAKAWYKGVKSGPVPTREAAESFDRSDYDHIAKGYFPYSMDLASVTEAWEQSFGHQ